MKNVLIAAAALVVGLLIGSVIPSAKIRGLEAEIDELETRTRTHRAEGIAQLFRQGAALTRSERREVPDPPTEDEPTQRENGVRFEVHGDPSMDEDPWRDLPEDAGVEAIREVMELRRTQAKEALRQQADADDAQLAAVDDAVDAMNTELRDLAERMVADVVEYGEPDRRQMLEFTAEALDVVLTADDAIRGAFDDDQLYDVEDPAIDPFSYIDPSILDVFENVRPPE